MAAIVIPAFQPDRRLLDVLLGLAGSRHSVVVVDDGSARECRPIFDQAAAMERVVVLRHATNLGKGAALRTGFNHVLCETEELLVTADADGQHDPADILKVAAVAAENPDDLVLGAREIGRNAPRRSRFGNRVTRAIVRRLHGLQLRDTQTGLRGLPRALAEAMLRVPSCGYEFEMDMLIAARRSGVCIREVPVCTRYFDGNRSSHFNPLLDSMRIYFVLLRFAAASLLTTILDNAVFCSLFYFTANALLAQVGGRLAAVGLYFSLNQHLVFHSRNRDAGTLYRYLGVVGVSGAASYLALTLLHQSFGAPIIVAKLLAETGIFFANFLLLRDFVFRSRAARATDWTAYYRCTPWIARLTRKYTAGCVAEALGKAALGERPIVLELGGGNSCFADTVERIAAPAAYHVLDSNPLGLELLRGRNVVLHQADVLAAPANHGADFAFSVGLIEHFAEPGTARAVGAHFEQVKEGGWVLLSFPTPTVPYRITRAALEAACQWRFPDERPLSRDEVLRAAAGWGELVWEKTLWPLPLTQHMVLLRAKAA